MKRLSFLIGFVVLMTSLLVACGGSSSPAPAMTPTFGAPTATWNGFRVQIINYDTSYTYTGTATASGSVSISGSGLVTVSGVARNTGSTATITTTRSNTLDGSAQVTATSLMAPVAFNKWCWSMQSDTLRGTFTSIESVSGNGTAPARTYTITDMSVVQSAHPDIELGSISNGVYAFGSQRELQIVWDGTAVTGFWRASGGYTNGFAMTNGTNDSGADIVFDINSQFARASYPSGTLIFQSSVTPTVVPVGASDSCPGEL